MGQPLTTLSLLEFLEWESAQVEKHEFHQGEVFAMVGGRRVHGRVALNIAIALSGQLKGPRCQVFADSMKVQIGAGTVLYPEVFVTGDAADLRTELVFTAPTVVVEVLSPSTQAYERIDKFTLYRGLTSLREHMMVSPDTRSVEVYRRGSDGLFTFHDFRGHGRIFPDSIDCELSTTDVFHGVDPS